LIIEQSELVILVFFIINIEFIVVCHVRNVKTKKLYCHLRCEKVFQLWNFRKYELWRHYRGLLFHRWNIRL